MLSRIFGAAKIQDRAHTLYEAIVAQARQPVFFAAWEVPDTVDGRFEMIALHAFLVMHRLKGAPQPAPAVAQALFDTMFGDMDRSLREMGAGDLGVGRRVKAMATAFYGRIAAYEAGLEQPGTATLEAALRRNAYGTLGEAQGPATRSVEALAAYVRAGAAALAGQATDEILAGRPLFPAPRVEGGNH